MADYNIYLIDPFNIMPITSVGIKLNQWFDPIAKQAGYSRAYVSSPQYIVQPQQHELLIYICPTGTSVVQNMPGTNKSTWPHPLTSQHQGVTVLGAVTGSEVWARFHDAEAFASLIFHEAMHNKLHLGTQLHSRFNPARLSCSPINWPTSPSIEEINAMASALANPVRQWTDGQRLLRDAAVSKKHGDPRWDSQILF